MFYDFLLIMFFISWLPHIIITVFIKEDWAENLFKLQYKNELYSLLWNFIWYLPVIIFALSYIFPEVSNGE